MRFSDLAEISRSVLLRQTTMTQRLYARIHLSLDKNHDTLTSDSYFRINLLGSTGVNGARFRCEGHIFNSTGVPRG